MKNPSAAVAAASENDEASSLPGWNLDELYTAPDAPAIRADLEWAGTRAKDFNAAYAGRLAELDGGEFGRAIARFETILERLHKIMSYAQLVFAGDMSNSERGRFLQTTQERYNAIYAEMLFFTLEINRIEDDVLEAKLSDPVAARYRPWLRDTRVFRPHQLSDELEKLLHDKAVTGAASWVRLFDQTMADLRFPVDGKNLTLADTLNLLDNNDTNVRRTGAQALGQVFGENIDIFSLITNTLAKDKEIEDKWRGYPHPVSARNLSNKVEDEVVDALVGSIRDAYADLAHRYYALKATWFGQDRLDYWDRNAPLPGEDGRVYSWDEGREIVLGAFGRFDPRIAAIAGKFFDNGWIDAAPRPGKESGAFCHPTVPSVHPYILLNFYGRPRDVATLAHELGHGVHQVLAADQGALLSDTPLTLAETASVFGEMLVFRALLEDQDDPGQRRRLLAKKVEDMLNTVVRQTAFHDFEQRVHQERRGGEISAERLGDIWLAIQSESLGPALRFDDAYRHFWAYVPHFVHSPFYVYAYAFGDCLVNSLYQVYSEGHAGFEGKFIEMLQAGGTLRHRDLLRPFGLDAGDPNFWRRGIDIVVGLIDELEAI